ncbi:hypothetical protein HYX01_03585, partial [Candidatus Woesearchaeota archaeon]|nr:hypothetical protein [Candidatus Woesearchaeota archaeon]
MKKAQMEIMGLTIVIVIIIIAVLFVIRFAFNKEPIETKKGYSQTELA